MIVPSPQSVFWSLLLALSVFFSQLTYYRQNSSKTKASVIFEKTQNMKTVCRLQGHQPAANTYRYLGMESEDALESAQMIKL
ncbi:MAG: hypothetical protein CMN54_02285 [SAR324 cluster bacterium]|uniref:Tyr recombinase domain-containing protein n=1 Tax=SAR324 cluster bacterium TaxID=2024889 RepID=A0A2D6YGJ5_9DELT|nr:hypothetical protein [SAR324 cluster bacterium]